MIAVVGAIDEKRAAELVDKAFADLPAEARAQARRLRRRSPAWARSRSSISTCRRSTIRFGRPALRRDDPDYIASVVLAHVLGGGTGLTSRLFREVREKRGLAYSVFGGCLRARTGELSSTAARRPRTSARTNRFEVIAAEIRDMARDGLNEEELEKGKNYLIGSYPLRFDTSTKIAGQLVHIQLEGHGAGLARRTQPRRSRA